MIEFICSVAELCFQAFNPIGLAVYIIAIILYFTVRAMAIHKVESCLCTDLVPVYQMSIFSHLSLFDIVLGLIPCLNVLFAIMFVLMYPEHVNTVSSNFENWCKNNGIEFSEDS